LHVERNRRQILASLNPAALSSERHDRQGDAGTGQDGRRQDFFVGISFVSRKWSNHEAEVYRKLCVRHWK
jgi:hypothetical protein